MQPDAEVRLPADSAYVAVLRMTTAGIAARLDFTLDDIEDLRMAVGEASAMLLERARPGGQLITRYFLGENRVAVRISVDAVQPTPPETNSFAWQVLTTTASDVSAETGEDVLTISLTVTSTTSSAPA
ncbi:anti-sigma factor [Nocardioides pocheonensis]|uniref:Anti-sigma factor n=1 Tax=Nocardioides pocheonensis TaxID=661485 RepID=A0A3N0GS58_9ACTN|nr:anti-sigma factor [Nocardioides pocheonensis]RNM15259.1 anti-sigma factor [Nocardioides pocheonensis]